MGHDKHDSKDTTVDGYKVHIHTEPGGHGQSTRYYVGVHGKGINDEFQISGSTSDKVIQDFAKHLNEGKALTTTEAKLAKNWVAVAKSGLMGP
ncbi:MAG: hypothetical protein ACKVOE_06105 [Rickettsiales bacterium]